ncbi:hypothetical protein DVH24_025086 [Malus domestica]|uniref:Uncharacterized protein n=1 Tax=Malus domestica TaxID=3750 RepID=A0A498KTB8_MALDO|nr:hypothetical protein DVH24_021220 [Malus domestica]RXI09624.1 hypothetical protein DVH24_025086 [Malus domestica]
MKVLRGHHEGGYLNDYIGQDHRDQWDTARLLEEYKELTRWCLLRSQLMRRCSPCRNRVSLLLNLTSHRRREISLSHKSFLLVLFRLILRMQRMLIAWNNHLVCFIGPE